MIMEKKRAAKLATLFLLTVFFVASFFILLPQSNSYKAQTRAKSLTKRTAIEGNTERTDYIDEHGIITIAADVGFATMIAVKKDHSRVEHFYDEKGEPIRRYSGYYGIIREYDQEGRNYHIRYLGLDDLPVITGYGYSDKFLTFYADGKIKTERYYDPFGNPVCSSTYGYGLVNEYDEIGRIIKITYLDEKDNPMKVGLGYAIVKRNLYQTNGSENGKVESEFYFDEEGKPIALSLGQYGVHKEYDEDGQESVLTYLDQKGNLIVTNKGYTTVQKTYHANNHTASELYYDIKGEPFALAEGQFGVKKDANQIVYLDKNGNESFNLRRLFYNQSWIIIPCAIIIIILSIVTGKELNAALCVLYIFSIVYFTLMFRERGEKHFSGLFEYYGKIFSSSDAREDILMNIWLFIPLGAVMYSLYPKRVILLLPIALSLIIEGIQLYSGNGLCELDDMISNSIGGYIGFIIGKLTKGFMQRINQWKHNHSV